MELVKYSSKTFLQKAGFPRGNRTKDEQPLGAASWFGMAPPFDPGEGSGRCRFVHLMIQNICIYIYMYVYVRILNVYTVVCNTNDNEQ